MACGGTSRERVVREESTTVVREESTTVRISCSLAILHFEATKSSIMKMQSFEIRVALLGYVSAGKSTVLNALFTEQVL